MKKRFFVFPIALLLLTLCVGALASCSGSDGEFDGKVCVVYELEGGTYQNSKQPITQYYDFKEGQQNLIKDPTSLSTKEVARSGYTFMGWYKTKTEAGEYTDPWSFETDKVGDEGVTLYAYWKKNVSYTFEICYRDGDKITVIDSYEVSEGEAFDDYLKYAEKRKGFTALGTYKDAEGNVVDGSYKHPGGEGDLAIQVFPDYIEGDYAIIRTSSDLLKAKGKDMYFMSDVDFAGKTFGGFGDYSGTIHGNGYSVKNFTLSYSNGKDAMITDTDLGEGSLLCVSLFSSIKGAVIDGLSFEGVKVEIGTGYNGAKQILFAPLTMKLENSSVTNVTVELEYSVGKLPDAFGDAEYRNENLRLTLDKAYFLSPANDSSTVDVTLNVTEKAAE